ncbi:MAG: hypothetical protein ABI643_02975 [Candidatus Doudnabacteria bacterium]
MYDFNSQSGLIIQGFIAVIVIGVFYNLWVSTKVYGGIIGVAIRLLGFGVLFVTISVIERVLINFSIIQSTTNLALIQDIFNVIGLIFLGLGFSKLSSAARA